MDFGFNALSLVGLLSLAGASAGTLSALVLWRIPYGHHVANRVLAALMIVLTLILLQRCFSAMGVVHRYPHLQGVAGPLNFMIGPMLYLYLRLMMEPVFSLRRKDLLHGIPVLLSFLCYLPVYLSDIGLKREFVELYLSASKPDFLQGEFTLLQTVNLFQMVAFSLSLGCYSLFSLRNLSRHKRALIERFSELESITLSWLGNLAWLAMVTTIASIVAITLSPYGAQMISSQVIPVTLLVGICFYGGYSGICQPLIYQYSDKVEVLSGEEKIGENVVKYKKSGLSEEGQRILWQQVRGCMEKEKPYLINGLTIAGLAERLDISVAYLSQTINAEAGVSFFDYINRARIEEALRLLDEEGARLSLSQLYLDVGFNSKSSFYTQFKKFNQGLTPKQYLADKHTST